MARPTYVSNAGTHLSSMYESSVSEIGYVVPSWSPTKMTSALWLSVHGCFSTVWILVPLGMLKQSPTARSSASTLFLTTNSTIARNATMTPTMMMAPRPPDFFVVSDAVWFADASAAPGPPGAKSSVMFSPPHRRA
jgi:hypothetical protein